MGLRPFELDDIVLEGYREQNQRFSQKILKSFELALTDYLEGDIYYKVSSPEQNLDRCMSLLTYALRAENQLDYMRRQIDARIAD